MFEAVTVAQSLSRDVAMAQIATAITTIFYSLVFAIRYYLVVKGNGALLREARREHRSGGGPRSSSRRITGGCQASTSSCAMPAGAPPGT
jgi:hypothetical protein